MTNSNKRQIGQEKETLAKEFLKEQGYIILESNFRCRCGEVDIIGRDQGYLTFIEVKYRATTKNGMPEEAVTPRKIRAIILTARYYMLTHNIREDIPCRFDVVSILKDQIRLIKNAFDGY